MVLSGGFTYFNFMNDNNKANKGVPGNAPGPNRSSNAGNLSKGSQRVPPVHQTGINGRTGNNINKNISGAGINNMRRIPSDNQGYSGMRQMRDNREEEISERARNVNSGALKISSDRKKKVSTGRKILCGAASGLLFVLTFVVVLLAAVFISLKMICSDISPSAKQMFVTTVLETGQMKFLASMFLSDDEIQSLVNSNSMKDFNEAVDPDLIKVETNSSGNSSDSKDIEIIEISGRTYFATMLIVKNPSSVSLATIYPWRSEGVTLDVLVRENNAVAGINGGIYNSNNNSGGTPYGVVVSGGEIQLNEPQQFEGLVLIGLTEDNILQVISLEGMSKADVEKMVSDKKIRDAVTFQEEHSDKNNHFVQLIINGKERELNGMGSGLNPRTVIGQREDGALLLLVTDGRGKSGHLGASASDLIEIMSEYGAVTAANLDGGSSSCMYHNGEYLMDSVTFYYSNSSWKLPFAFIVK